VRPEQASTGGFEDWPSISHAKSKATPFQRDMRCEEPSLSRLALEHSAIGVSDAVRVIEHGLFGRKHDPLDELDRSTGHVVRLGVCVFDVHHTPEEIVQPPSTVITVPVM
jgi:hypothetical protein